VERDRDRWDERYADRAPAEAAPPDALANDADLLSLVASSGRAADIACGTGGQTIWLALRGLSVDALDISPIAVDLTQRAAAAAGVDGRVTARVHDLDDGLPRDLTDLDVLVCQRFRSPAIYQQIPDALVSGGIAIVAVLSQVGRNADAIGPFHAPPGELIEAFSGAAVEVLRDCEADGQASIVVRRT
jgi:SAM-dependent methyltransferase